MRFFPGLWKLSLLATCFFWIFVCPSPTRGADIVVANWIGVSDGNWSDPANWDTGTVPNNTADVFYYVNWEQNPVRLRVDVPVRVSTFRLTSGGTLDVESSLTVADSLAIFFWYNGTITGSGSIVVDTYQLERTPGWRRIVDGRTLGVNIMNLLTDSVEFRNRPLEGLFAHMEVKTGGHFYTDRLSQDLFFDVTPEGTRSHIENLGLIELTKPVTSKADFFNHNLMTITGADLTLSNSDIIQDGGSLMLTNASILSSSPDPAHGKVVIESGTLDGVGQIDVAVVGSSGQVPAVLSGNISFKDLTLETNGVLSVRIASRQFDRFYVSHSFTRHGRLAVDLTDGFENVIRPSDVFDIVTVEAGGTATGAFSNVAIGQRLRAGNFGTFLVTHPAGDAASIELRDFVPIAYKIQPGNDPEFGYYPLPLKTYYLGKTDEILTNAPVNWTGGTLELKIANPTPDEDHFGILSEGTGAGQIQAQRDAGDPGKFNISYGGTVFATATGFLPNRDLTSGADLVFNLSATVTTEAIQALVRHSIYTNDVYGFDAFTNDLARVFPDRDLTITVRDADNYHATEEKTIHFPKVLSIATIPPYINITPSIPKVVTIEAIFDNIQRTESQKVGSQVHYSSGGDCGMDASEVAITPDSVRPEVVTVSWVGATAPDVRCSIVARAGPFTALTCLRITSLGPGILHCLLDAADDDAAPLCGSPAANVFHISSGPRPPESHSGLMALASLHTLETVMKQSEEGRRLADLYWRHSTELVYLCVANPTLFAQTRDVVSKFQVGLNSFLAGKGTNSAVISASAVSALNLFWNAVTNRCSPALRADMVAERARFNGFQDFVGKNFAQWGEMLQIQAPTNAVVTISNSEVTSAGFTAEANIITGARYALFRSKDLLDWTPLPLSTLKTNGFFLNITDPSPPPTGLYYKLSVNPP